MMDFIAKPFGALMEFIYNNLAFHNYGVAIIFFTLFVKIVLLPLTVKQQRSMERQQMIQPELEALQNKYKDDRKKLQEEQMNLYTKYNISPMSGCLPMLLQFPIILAIYQIIRRPLTYIAGLSSGVVKELIGKVNETWANGRGWSGYEIQANKHFIDQAASFADLTGQSGQWINMKFLKIFDLGETPKWKVWEYGDQWKVYLPLLLIPILAVATSYLQMFISNRLNNANKKKDDKEQPALAGMNGMLKILPLMTLFIAFVVPAGLGFYWIVSNIFGILQTILLKKLFNIKKEGSA